MASSVSSERAFSAAGITISKRHNRLKPDVVEALQFLKCIYRRDLLFREDLCAEIRMEKLEIGSPSEVSAHNRDINEEGWDNVVENLQDDEGFEDYDDNDVFVQDIL